MGDVQATVVLEFNGGDPDASDYLFHIQLDDESNDDKTSFLPTEEPVIQAHFSTNIRVDAVVATDGEVQRLNSVSREIETEQLFSSRDEEELTELTLPVVPNGTEIEYFGREGAFTTEDLSGSRVKYISDIDLTPFLAKITNTYTTRLYRLIPPDLELDEDETYNIFIVFYLTLVD